MKNNVAIALTLLAILALPIMTVSAPTYKVGVKVGDWAKYGMTGGWSFEPSTANLTEPQEVTNAKKVDWIEIRVLEVSGTSVTIQATARYENKTEKTSTHSGDVRTGSGDLAYQVIAGSLSEGDKIFEAEEALEIQTTALSSYAGFQREINYGSFTIPVGEGTYRTFEFGWDKVTGIIAYTWMERRAMLEDYNSTALTIMTMAETNIFQTEASWDPGIMWIVVVGSTVILIAFAYVITGRKERKRKRTLTKRLKIILNPEIHHKSKVKNAIKFCEEMDEALNMIYRRTLEIKRAIKLAMIR